MHDFISENKFPSATFQSRAGSPWHVRQEETLERRASVRESRKKLFLAKMVKWQLVRKFRAEYLDKQDKTRVKLFRATDFARMISFFTIVAKHRQNCRLKIWIRRRIAEMTEKRAKIIQWIQEHLIRIGPSIEYRQT